MNILIIDDDAEDVELFCEALNEVMPLAICSHKNSCSDIVDFIKENVMQDIIFIDGHMHPMNGRECCIQLAPFIDSAKTKIVIHTGSLRPNEIEEFRALGVSEIMFKDSSYERMKTSLHDLMSRLTK